MKTVEQLAQSTNPTLVRAFGAIRRFAIALTDTAIWQVAGVLMPDGREAMRAELFGSVGIFARPPTGAEVDAIGVMVGDATTPTLVGVRDEQTRAAVVGDLKPDETALYNSKALVHAKDDGRIQARSVGGTAKRLATVEDIENLRDWIANTMVVVTPSGNSTPGTFNVPPSADGTQIFEAE